MDSAPGPSTRGAIHLTALGFVLFPPWGGQRNLLDDSAGFGLQLTRLAGSRSSLTPEEIARARRERADHLGKEARRVASVASSTMKPSEDLVGDQFRATGPGVSTLRHVLAQLLPLPPRHRLKYQINRHAPMAGTEKMPIRIGSSSRSE